MPAGKGAVFFDPPTNTSGASPSIATGNVFAGTGDKGVIYKITPDGKGAPFYQTKATHAMSLAFDREGRLLAGTESPGRVFQIDAAGKPFVLLDSTYNEIRTLRVDAKGDIYAAAVSGRGAGGGATARRAAGAGTGAVADRHRSPPRSPSIADRSTSAVPPQRRAGATARRPGPGAGAVFRIAPDGASDLVWESREDTPYDIAFETRRQRARRHRQQGQDLSAGRRPDQPTLVARANAQQVTTLLPRPRRADAVRHVEPRQAVPAVGRRAPTAAPTPRTSATRRPWPHGARSSGRRGARRHAVEISTRSGNTRTPDETWSDWSAPTPTAKAARSPARARATCSGAPC